jgi:hypothetical protein
MLQLFLDSKEAFLNAYFLPGTLRLIVVRMRQKGCAIGGMRGTEGRGTPNRQ